MKAHKGGWYPLSELPGHAVTRHSFILLQAKMAVARGGSVVINGIPEAVTADGRK